ncbi:hypothetical protein F5Y17DRAFT_86863 [Xylariaceae sp. FL0594]|nr:hypothetical protein F5Y17DRAFT_86863 [Xylariaceae sp. FL0594]
MDAEKAIGESPPPYTALTPSTSYHHSSATSHLQHHLASLPSRIRHVQQAHSLQRALDDASLIDFLVPEVETFLAHIGDLAQTPRVSHLTLVPASADIPPGAVLSGVEELRRRGELCEVVTVDMFPKGGGKKGMAIGNDKYGGKQQQGSDDIIPGKEFSDWGRFGESGSHDASQAGGGNEMLWWKDEGMARRLARHLQPSEPQKKEPPPPVLETPVQKVVEERLPRQKEKKGWFWGRKGSASSSNAAPSVTKAVERTVLPERDGDAHDSSSQLMNPNTNGAKMTVTAEEVAFRVENDFGIMESRRGWAVVVVVHVRA